MTHSKVYLAVDLGASSGRVVVGRFDGRRLSLSEAHRFDNGGVTAGNTLYWDVLRQWRDVQDGLRAAAEMTNGAAESIGVDTWGVDFGLVGRDDRLVANPVHYRDRRTEGILDRAFQVVGREEIFAHTGMQFMEFNTLFQLWAMREQGWPALDAADALLMMPDVFHWLLTGNKANEFTNATTTQCLDPRTRSWATSLIDRFQIPVDLFQTIIEPGTRLGSLRKEIGESTGLRNAHIVVPGTHDTASAVMAVPAASRLDSAPDWAYISSGTWSLMGVETPQPVINEDCSRLNFTNEGGIGGTVRLLKNIAGLWLVQECRRVWSRQGRDYSWDHLVSLATSEPPLRSLINPDDPSLIAPASMPDAIVDCCRKAGQPVPETEGAVIRCALESLAFRYRTVLGWLEQLIGGRIETVHIVGGGAQNQLLCQMAADAMNRLVVAGPVEATAIGNLMMQSVAAGDTSSIADARAVVRRSFGVVEFQPRDAGRWDGVATSD